MGPASEEYLRRRACWSFLFLAGKMGIMRILIPCWASEQRQPDKISSNEPGVGLGLLHSQLRREGLGGRLGFSVLGLMQSHHEASQHKLCISLKGTTYVPHDP